MSLRSSAQLRGRISVKESKDERCFFSPAITDGLVTRRLARSYRHFTIPRFKLLTEGGVNHTLGNDQNVLASFQRTPSTQLNRMA